MTDEMVLGVDWMGKTGGVAGVWGGENYGDVSSTLVELKLHVIQS